MILFLDSFPQISFSGRRDQYNESKMKGRTFRILVLGYVGQSFGVINVALNVSFLYLDWAIVLPAGVGSHLSRK